MHQSTSQLLLESTKHELVNVLYGSAVTVVLTTCLIVLEQYYEDYLVGYQPGIRHVFGFYIAWLGFWFFGVTLNYTICSLPLLRRMLIVATTTSTLIIVSTTMFIHFMSPQSINPWPTLALINAMEFVVCTNTTFFALRAPMGWSNIPKRLIMALSDNLSWVVCGDVLFFAMCAAYLAGKALSGSTAQESGKEGTTTTGMTGEEGTRMTGLTAARVVVFGLGMPVFRVLFLKYVAKFSIARVGSTDAAATSMEALNVGCRGRKGQKGTVEDVEEGQKDVGSRRWEALTLKPQLLDTECPATNEIIAEPGLVRMVLTFESGFSMVDTVILLLTQSDTAYAFAIVGSHAVHLVQCYLRGRRWRNILKESKLKTGFVTAGLNTWTTINTTNGAAAYTTTLAAMVMVLCFDARGVLSDLHPHARREQVAVRTGIAMVVQVILNVLLTAFEVRMMEVPIEWRRLRLPMFARLEAAAIIMMAVGAFLVVERGVFGVF
ncbi:hypothetical protein HK104_010371 [Borealophlyctis nickersoniae]|nr:hypothetical protein HK104_010371 [Borealophlyctis nickersoniae]